MRALSAVILLAALPSTALAGDTFGAAELHPGEYVFVTDASGVEISGLLREASAQTILIGDFTFTPWDTLRIERHGDSVWDGAAKGFAAGALTLLLATDGDVDGSHVLTFGTVSALWGALIDVTHTGRTRIYGPPVMRGDPALSRDPGPLLWTRHSDATGLDFRRLPAARGDILYVAASSGAIVGGRLTELSPGQLTIGGYSFRPEPGLTVYRHGDALWDGAARGFLVGAALELGTKGFGEACLASSRLRCVLRSGATMGLIGVLIDRAHVGRTRIFRIANAKSRPRIRIAPFAGASAAGLMMTWGF